MQVVETVQCSKLSICTFDFNAVLNLTLSGNIDVLQFQLYHPLQEPYLRSRIDQSSSKCTSVSKHAEVWRSVCMKIAALPEVLTAVCSVTLL